MKTIGHIECVCGRFHRDSLEKDSNGLYYRKCICGLETAKHTDSIYSLYEWNEMMRSILKVNRKLHLYTIEKCCNEMSIYLHFENGKYFYKCKNCGTTGRKSKYLKNILFNWNRDLKSARNVIQLLNGEEIW